MDTNIWHHDSGIPGKHVMIIGGMHGNERTGIRMVQELAERFSEGREDAILTGRLTLAIGNPEAVRLGTRGSAPHLDLNRSFLPERLADQSVYEHRRAAELLHWLDQADVLIDLHATNKPSEPFLAVTKLTPEHEKLFDCFDCSKIVLNDDTVLPGMAQGYVNARGGTALVFESGQADDLSCMQKVRDAVERVLGLYDVIDHLPDGFVPSRKERFQIIEPLLLTRNGFRFAQHRGLASFEPMTAGDTIGFVGHTPVRAPYDGVLMFPKIPSLWKIGAPLVFFAERLH